MLNDIKAIQYAALMDEQHRLEHPENVDGCAYCEYLQDEAALKENGNANPVEPPLFVRIT